jgi:glycosyltransferase involved in cell wall biosynthesis
VSAQTNLISVIIPVFNREEFLAEAIQSALAQRNANVEILVVDDGSTDGTAHVAEQFRDLIQYFYQENAGPPAARNRGIAAARGDWLAFLDSDDLWPPDRMQVLLQAVSSNPGVGIVMGHMQFIPLAVSRSADFDEARRTTPAVLNYNLSATLIRASLFASVGLFDVAMRYSDDWDWFVRAREQNVAIEFLPEVSLINRRHAGNLSNQREVGNHYTLFMLKKALDRRRKEGANDAGA